MALIKCPSCNRAVSELDETCRHCSAVIRQLSAPPMITPAKKLVLGLIVLLIACWIYASPYLAVQGVKKAVKNGDAVALADYVNFPALKESLKASFTAQMTKSMGKMKDNPFSALGVGMANALINPMIDALVSPEGLSGMMNGHPNIANLKEEKIQEARSGANDDEPIVKMGYESFNRFTVKASDKSNPTLEITMVFLRDGLSWKLSAIKFPIEEIEKLELEQKRPVKEVEAELVKPVEPKEVEAEGVPEVAARNWDYSERKHEMTGEVRKIATNKSVNTVNFNSPYKGDQHGWLMLIDETPIFYVEKGQVICNDKCYVLAKFDDGKAELVSAYKIGDESTTIRFGELSDTGFLNNMKKSKKLMLEIEVYKNGRPVFIFDVSGLNQK